MGRIISARTLLQREVDPLVMRIIKSWTAPPWPEPAALPKNFRMSNSSTQSRIQQAAFISLDPEVAAVLR